ncbi:hypothetical protein LUZ60_005848 [Juncus effusus]|nr:hypothetical protein LUZ60_005848 [Juncus effusus]
MVLSQEIIEISNQSSIEGQSGVDTCASSSSSHSSDQNPPSIEIDINFHDDSSRTTCSRCSSSISSSSSYFQKVENEQVEKEEDKLFSLPSMKMEFIEFDANGDLKWREVDVEETSDASCKSPQCKVEASDTGEVGNINVNLSSSKIKIYLDACGRKMCEETTEKEIIQAILYSASVNNLRFSQEEATECAKLILEELQADQVKIQINSHIDMSTYATTPSPWSTQSLPLPLPSTNHHSRLSSPFLLALRTNWRRFWIAFLWLSICAGLFAWKFVQYRHRSAFQVMGYCLTTAKGAAETLKFNMALVLLPVCRNTVTWLRKSRRIGFFVPFNDTINFHKLIAGGIIIGIILHAGVHLTCDFPRIINANPILFRRTIGRDFGYVKPSYLNILTSIEGFTGLIMVVLIIFAFLLALSPPRRNPQSLPGPIRRFVGFNSFWYSHHVFVLVYVLLIVHSMFLFLAKDFTEKTTWMYIAIPVIIYVGERIVRTIRSEVYTVKIMKARIYPGKVISLKMKKPSGFKYRSGMFVFVRCPQISNFEWHPFSLTSAPDDDHLSMHVRSLGDWSYEFYTNFQEALILGNSNLPKIAIDGPYGSASQDHTKYDIILLIGLGIGATPFVSVLKDIANNLQKVNGKRKRKAYFYWVTREQGSFEWFRDIMKEVSHVDKNKGVIEMYNYLTSIFQEGDKRSALISAIQALHFTKNGIDIISRTPVRTQFARPNWPRVFSGLASRHGGENIGVFYCGPKSLGRELERLCHGTTVKTAARFIFHKEHY